MLCRDRMTLYGLSLNLRKQCRFSRVFKESQSLSDVAGPQNGSRRVISNLKMYLLLTLKS